MAKSTPMAMAIAMAAIVAVTGLDRVAEGVPDGPPEARGDGNAQDDVGCRP
jgi:hypothetical protein